MKLEDQVCSLELAQKLRDLGVEQYGLWTWCCIDGAWSVEWSQSNEPIKASNIATAFTVAELGEMLPDKYAVPRKGYEPDADAYLWGISLEAAIITAFTEADARAKMLIYLIENKLVSV